MASYGDLFVCSTIDYIPLPPLLPQPSGNAYDRVGGPVAVSETARAEQVNVHWAVFVGQAGTHASDADRCGPVG